VFAATTPETTLGADFVPRFGETTSGVVFIEDLDGRE
jgi:hypothetical protein